ncbi:MAG: septum formation protein Maf [Bacilli bacterium]|nr:septum formation protein Maf [Bacilli bacterium]
MKLILASNSRTRKEILDKVGLKYEVCPSNIEEHSIETNPKEYVMDLSRQKGLAIASNVSEGVILSADSIIYIDDKKLEKPKTKESAKEMLKLLSGRVNYAVTGVTIVDKYQDKTITFNEVTEVYFDEMSDEEMNWYIENEQFIFERCGYSIAGKSAIYIPKINGDYYNILGMPISRVYKELHKLGYNLSDFE